MGAEWFISCPFQSFRRSWGDCDQRHKFRCASEGALREQLWHSRIRAYFWVCRRTANGLRHPELAPRSSYKNKTVTISCASREPIQPPCRNGASRFGHKSGTETKAASHIVGGLFRPCLHPLIAHQNDRLTIFCGIRRCVPHERYARDLVAGDLPEVRRAANSLLEQWLNNYADGNPSLSKRQSSNS